MAQLKRRRGRIQIRLDNHERDALLSVVSHLREHAAASPAAGQRAYQDDDKQAEYDLWVKPELENNRESDIDTIRDDLMSGEDHILLTDLQAYSWLRGLNHLRLAAATLVGADQDGWEERATEQDRERAEFRMFLLLSYVQEELVVTLGS